jgi:MFS family permease
MSTLAEVATTPARAVGAFTAAGYVGWVAGAPLVGTVSDVWSPEAGLLMMAGLCVVLIVAVLAGAVPTRSRRETSR